MSYPRRKAVSCAAMVALSSGVWAAVPNADVLSRAERGDAAAQITVGEAYEAGEYGASSVARAEDWYLRAVNGARGDANYHLGVLYEFGHGVTQSYARARTYYELGADQGSAAAVYRLALLYFGGWGVTKDRPRGIELLSRSAEANYLPAIRMLSKVYYFGLGVPKDTTKAVAWAEQAAKQDDAEGEFLVGINGIRVKSAKESVQASREWLKLSSENEYTQAMIAMAASYMSATAAEQDAALAKRWLELALEGGDGDAGFLLALHELFVASRTHTPVNELALRSALEKAAVAGNHKAKEVLDLVRDGRSYIDAMRWVMTVPDETRYVQREAAKGAKETGSADRQPRPIHMVKATYPDVLRVSGEKGQVMVRFVVDETGHVIDPVVVESSHPAFSENALAAVKQWEFTPGYRGGRAVKTRMQVPVIFELSLVPSPKSVAAGAASTATSTSTAQPSTAIR